MIASSRVYQMESPAQKYPTVTLDGFTYRVSCEMGDWASAERSLDIDIYGGNVDQWRTKTAFTSAVVLFASIHRAWKKIHRRDMTIDDAYDLLNLPEWEQMSEIVYAHVNAHMEKRLRKVQEMAKKLSNGVEEVPLPSPSSGSDAARNGSDTGVTVVYATQELPSGNSGD